MSKSDRTTRRERDDPMTLEQLRDEYSDELERLAGSDLPAAWVAEAFLEDGDQDE